MPSPIYRVIVEYGYRKKGSVKHYKYKRIDTFVKGNWNLSSGQNLEREEHEFEIKECQYCGHVSFSGDYCDEMFCFLYPKNYKSLTTRIRPWIFESICDFTIPHMKIENKIRLADWGGADGYFLRNLITRLGLDKAKIHADCYGFRTEIVLDEYIDFHFCDFNNMADIKRKIQDFDFGFCIHTLEHLLYPREFLKSLYTYNMRGFHLYIEVPALELLEERHVTHTEMVQPQHIQMFSKGNLEFMASTLGYSIMDCRYENEGDIPRIQLLIKKDVNAKNNVKEFLDYKKSLINKLASVIIEECSAKKKIGLWGIGQEFYNLAKSNTDVIQLIQSGNPILIDSYLSGKSVFGTQIVNPADVPTTLDKILILPLVDHTRDGIMEQAMCLGFSKSVVID